MGGACCRRGGAQEEGGGAGEGAKADVDMAFTNEVMDPKYQILEERVGINKRQLFTLDKSWKGIQRKLTDTGMEMMIL